MNRIQSLLRTRTSRIAAFALAVLVLDQITKAVVLQHLALHEERVVVEGFFKLVYWQNKGAAWSFFQGYSQLLAAVAFLALIILFYARHHFDSKSLIGQLALGLLFGGITGNLIDRLRFGYVVDFLYFYLNRPAGELGFPAFNVADSAICVGVGLIFLLSWKEDRKAKPAEPPAAK
jgi:signal peptidase II